MLRPLLVAAALVAITLILIPLQWISIMLRAPTRRLIPVGYHRAVCALLGVRIKVIGQCLPARPLLLVANHSSWLDVPVITAVAPVVFVAKQEVASWPLLGLLAKLQRSVFVDRGRRQKTLEVNAQIAQRLAAGDPVVLFGEGTSSDGNRILPFRTALIGAARDALAAATSGGGVMIQPLSIAYVGLDGLPLGRQHRPVATWYGDMDFVSHLRGVLRHGALDVVVSWGEPIPYQADSDRKAVARSLESQVRGLTIAAQRGGRRQGAARNASRPFLFTAKNAKTGRFVWPGLRRHDGHRTDPPCDAP
jgi:lyso-ornithine lipid O-acyltransferase